MCVCCYSKVKWADTNVGSYTFLLVTTKEFPTANAESARMSYMFGANIFPLTTYTRHTICDYNTDLALNNQLPGREPFVPLTGTKTTKTRKAVQ